MSNDLSDLDIRGKNHITCGFYNIFMAHQFCCLINNLYINKVNNNTDN